MGLTALVFIALIAALFGLILGGHSATGASTLPEPPPAAYVYDSPLSPTADTHTHHDRGPPSARVNLRRHHADDLGSSGSSARADGVITATSYTYDITVQFLLSSARGDRLQGVTATTTTLGQTQATDGKISSLAPALVAANTGSRLLRPSSLADELAQSAGGVVKANKGGYTVNIPNGSRGITVRVMERGGSRTNYYRVSVPGKETYTVTGEASMDANLTHIGIGESSLDDILSIVARIQGGG